MATFEGFVDLADELNSAASRAAEQADRLESDSFDHEVEQSAKSVKRRARRLVPVDEGTLQSTIDYAKMGFADYRIGSPLDYADDVEYGTGPHVITGDPLHFFMNGEEVFATKVDHPGTDAQPYLRPALRQTRSELERRMQRLIRDVFRSTF